MDTRRMTGGGGPEAAVLEDPTGRRALWMQRAGRVVFVVFLAWLIAIVLSGLGLAPVPGIPFAHVLRPSAGPPPLVRLPLPRQPSPADLLPALPDAALAPQVSPAARPKLAPARGRSGLAPGQTKTTRPATGRGRSGTAPGRTKTSPSVTTPRGRSTTAPGQTKTTPATSP